MTKRMLLANVMLAGLAVLFAAWLVRDLAHSRPLPPPPAPRHPQAAGATAQEPKEPTVAEEKLANYNVIAAKSLFNPSRSEGTAAAAATAAPLPPKPILHGLIIDGPSSVAYLEDPSTNRVLAYRVGDAVAGGRLEKITEDGVSIRRSDGQLEVLLKDPGKPQPAPAGGALQQKGASPTGPPAAAQPRPPAPPARSPRTIRGEQPPSPQQ